MDTVNGNADRGGRAAAAAQSILPRPVRTEEDGTMTTREWYWLIPGVSDGFTDTRAKAVAEIGAHLRRVGPMDAFVWAPGAPRTPAGRERVGYEEALAADAEAPV